MTNLTVRLAEASRSLLRLGTCRNATATKSDKPQVGIQSAYHCLRDAELLEVAIGFMDEYSDVFGELAK